MDSSGVPHQSLRGQLMHVLGGIEPWDDLERSHLAETVEWITGGAPLYRTQKPATPAKHLVSYFVVLDETCEELLLVAHRKAGLWLPSGGHVEPMEDPWNTVRRECREELRIEAVPASIAGDRPLFLTVTRTRGQGQHTDVSLWYVLRAEAGQVTSFDEAEFDAIKWLSLDQVLATPEDTLDPHMHRFTRKLMSLLALQGSAR
ncbi:NUDIX hydrolase [Streptomyces sp. NBC_00503]|uniref:NUDIX hydrolase n=1 Tax=Streptomyces sp. NBC_00503 TaxID=2903659 RepID=UPI002E817AB5|nr:NUDIX domain-containing protein [Streptomyces sp. NBC_00503]WUD85945.1 NUDIX domain-containing protein [Streptomyces sp. NBC_00503]